MNPAIKGKLALQAFQEAAEKQEVQMELLRRVKELRTLKNRLNRYYVELQNVTRRLQRNWDRLPNRLRDELLGRQKHLEALVGQDADRLFHGLEAA